MNINYNIENATSEAATIEKEFIVDYDLISLGKAVKNTEPNFEVRDQNDFDREIQRVVSERLVSIDRLLRERYKFATIKYNTENSSTVKARYYTDELPRVRNVYGWAKEIEKGSKLSVKVKATIIY